MISELKIPFNLHDIFYCLRILFHYFKNPDLKFELFIKIFAFLKNFQSILSFFIVSRFVINNLKHFPEGTRTQNSDDFKSISNVIANYWLVVIFLISKIILLLVFSEVSFMSDVINIFIVPDFLLFELSQVHWIQMVPDNRLGVELLDTKR